MNTSAKGAMLERKAIAILERDDYVVWRTIRSTYNRNDLFGADLLAIKLGERPRAVQVTTKGVGITVKRMEFEHWPWPRDHVALEVWLWCGKPPAGLTREEHAATQYFEVRRADTGFVQTDEVANA